MMMMWASQRQHAYSTCTGFAAPVTLICGRPAPAKNAFHDRGCQGDPHQATIRVHHGCFLCNNFIVIIPASPCRTGQQTLLDILCKTGSLQACNVLTPHWHQDNNRHCGLPIHTCIWFVCRYFESKMTCSIKNISRLTSADPHTIYKTTLNKHADNARLIQITPACFRTSAAKAC